MYPIRKDLPFYASLRMLESIGFYSENTNGFKKRSIVRTLIFCILCWSIILLSAVLLIYENLNDKNYASVFFNIAVAVASTSTYCCTLLFVKYQEKWSDILTALVNYEKFGKPRRYNQLKERGDRVAMACWGGILTGVFLYMLFAILHENDCELEKTGGGVCGLIIPTWLPAPYDNSLLARRLVLLYDIPNAAAVSSFVLVTHLNIQVNEFNIARIDHLSLLFNDIEFCKDPQAQLNKMKHCIEYHQDIIRVSLQFKNLSKRTMGHMTLTFTIVTASMGCQLLQTSKNFYQENAFFFEIIYVINMFIMCYCGQRLEYKMKTVGDFLYSTHWYNLNPKLQSLIPLVILNSQKTIRMDAVPIGYLNYELFVTVRIRKSGYL
ncbi:hypothetical protein HUJ04_001493 [Dendroctonus ponderosae]|uniref:Odorant receptor n=1 Tax=Dendroctonus ponderosae TaxID=77166 RepID=A0AAR5Q9Z8_DENPD|nr:hypothetical protein HUJ04_001493 [Dendroctonus ponderosae]